jgi:hypothetical protein
MAGQGRYDRNSEAQARDALSQADLVVDAARRIAEAPAPAALVLADYGCAQGRVSNALIQAAIDEIRRVHREVPILVIHNDLLSNDWAGLFVRLASPGAYVATPGGPITPLASATSFYAPVAPPGDVGLALSFAAIQWLSSSGPPGTGRAIFFDQLDQGARAEVAERAHADWTRFLSLRANELASGGLMVLDMMGRHDDGAAAAHDLWAIVSDVCAQMADEGLIAHERLDALVMPLYERTIAEVRRPFDEGAAGGLRLEHLSIEDNAHPATERYARDRDPDALADGMAGFFRAFSEPTIRAALALDDAALDDLYGRVQEQIRHRAEDFSFVVHVITAVVAKREESRSSAESRPADRS